MDLVVRAIGLFFLVFASTARAELTTSEIESALDRWEPLIEQAAQRFAIPALWIRDVMRLESAGQSFLDGQPTTSQAGAMGLMQLMPTTYKELRERYGFGADPYDPNDNIFAGAAYLRELYKRYGWPSLFAAYHAGPARLEAYLLIGKPLPKATRGYLAALIPERQSADRLKRSTTRIATIFVRLSRSDGDSKLAPIVLADDHLFVHLSVARVPDETPVDRRNHASTEASDARD